MPGSNIGSRVELRSAHVFSVGGINLLAERVCLCKLEYPNIITVIYWREVGRN